MEKLTTTDKIKLIELAVEICKIKNDYDISHFTLINNLLIYYATKEIEINKDEIIEQINHFYKPEE